MTAFAYAASMRVLFSSTPFLSPQDHHVRASHGALDVCVVARCERPEPAAAA